MSAIRILRVLEYVYSDPEIAAEDQTRWTHSINNKRLVMRSATLPFEAVDWTAPVEPAARTRELVRLLHEVDGQLGLAVHRGEGNNLNWKQEAEALITRLRQETKRLEAP